MPEAELPTAADDPQLSLIGVQKVPAARPGPSPIVRAEANLLRFPLFAIGTKNLRTLDGIQCSGRMTRHGESYQFTYKATRNTATLYPGPLARRAHLAFLSILGEHGTPTPRTLTWSWYDLCRRMEVSDSGSVIRHLKDSILATTGLLIESDLAFYSKANQALIRTEQQALHLYDRVAFVGTELPDGTKADQNLLWLSDWYRENLDAFFTAPLDYPLWKYLDARSPIASRLYEFLLVNLFGPAPIFRINYETLVRFLPVQAEKYRSQAQNQLGGALELLRTTQVLKSAEWTESKSGIAALLLARGDRLSTAAKKTPTLGAFSLDELVENVEVKELRNIVPPETQLVQFFYQEWTGAKPMAPSAKELDQARGLLKEHGPQKAKALVRNAIRHMKVRFPDAKAFGAVSFYMKEAHADLDKAERRAVIEKQERERMDAEEDELKARKRAQQELEEVWLPRWKQLSNEKQAEITQAVLQVFPRFDRMPHLLENRCVLELRNRTLREQGAAVPAEAPAAAG